MFMYLDSPRSCKGLAVPTTANILFTRNCLTDRLTTDFIWKPQEVGKRRTTAGCRGSHPDATSRRHEFRLGVYVRGGQLAAILTLE